MVALKSQVRSASMIPELDKDWLGHGVDGEALYRVIADLFPLCRSITGAGTRSTLDYLSVIAPLDLVSVPSGTGVFDWIVPDEWHINDAYIKDEHGERIIDFSVSNLHVVNYSVGFEGRLRLDELRPHLYTLPDLPDAIPYVTSYYERKWGFCLTHRQYLALTDQWYHVRIDAGHRPGALLYGECVVPGLTDEEVLISTYVCHPSMANDNLSGPSVAAYLAKALKKRERPLRYTYRFVFIPETIGALAYLSSNLERLQNKIVAGYVLTCLGDPGAFSYLCSRRGDALIDRLTQHVLGHATNGFALYDFLERGSDERQYCAPRVDLPVGSLMRSKYYEFKEYHTSLDDLGFVKPDALKESFDLYLLCFYALEHNRVYRSSTIGEPQLGRRGLYPNTGLKKDHAAAMKMLSSHLIAYCDGEHDLLWIADKLRVPIWELVPLVQQLEALGVISADALE